MHAVSSQTTVIQSACRVVLTLATAVLLSGTSAFALNTTLTNLTSRPAASAPILSLGARSSTGSAVVIDPAAAAIGAKMKGLLPAGPVKPAPDPQPEQQQRALRLLRERAGDDVQAHFRTANGTVAQIRGQALERPSQVAKADPGERDAQTARAFLRANRDLLRLDDPDRELVMVRQERDDLGHAHVKFEQTWKGLPLWPSDISVHLAPNGTVYLMDGAYAPTPTAVATVATVTADHAAARARASLADGEKGEVTPPALIIYTPLAQPPRLAWKLTLSTTPLSSWVVIIDALDGRVLNQVSQVMDGNITTSQKDLLGHVRDLNVWSQDGTFFMFDTSKPMFKAGTDPLNQSTAGVIRVFDGANRPTEEVFRSALAVTTTNVNNWLPDAVSAAFNFSLTYDYFWKNHGRDSLDGKGGSILAIVRISDQPHNAAWVGQYGLMVFGNDLPLPAGLDVIGHELTHGVTEKTAGLIYQDQPGALNEAFSDIFGELVEASRDGKPDWLLGEELNFIFRNMKSPGDIKDPQLGPMPGKMSEFKNLPADVDHGGVHINSSIINHACYLLAEGLNDAIGLTDTGKIFYRCLTQHLQKQSQFIDARLGCIASAEALFGADSIQARKVAEAFDAVEIFATPATPEPSPIPAVQGPDSSLLIGIDPSTLDIALGRAEAALGDPSDGVALVESVKEARPAVAGDGSFALFVDAINDLCGVDTNDPKTLQCLGLKGLVHSVALSPNGQLAAFVLRDPATGQPLNQINVYDLVKDTTRTFKLLSPLLDGVAVNDVLYADSMVFTSDSATLIYDALAQLRFAAGQPVQRWSIYALNLDTQTTTVLLPPQEGFDTGNPNIGRAGNRFLTFDARDTGTGNTAVINLDLFTGEFGLVGQVGAGLGFPCFTGDESAVVYTTRDPSAFFTGFSLVRQPLASDRLTRTGQVALWIPDATIGVIYRRGTFVSSNAPPQVRLLSPTPGQSVLIPGELNVEAAATDPDGNVVRVEFYDGADKLQEVATAPYRFSLKFGPETTPHELRLVARAIDNLGAAADSAPMTVTVGQSGGGGGLRMAAARLSSATIRLTFTGAAGSYTVQQSTDLKRWTDIYPVTISATGSASLDDSGGPVNYPILFYRVRKN
jgi:bacillolysin